MFEAAYLKTLREGRLQEKVAAARKMMESCTLCPRMCNVNRLEGELGFCGVGANAVISSASPHFGEESPLVGVNGSGTIFMTSCNLKCVFCQNFEISHLMDGAEMDDEGFGKLMLGLQNMGCHNINIVTPSHQVPQLLAALQFAANRGLQVPLVYNTGGYDSLETLKILDGVVDIYMPDIKFADRTIAGKLMDAEDYPEIAFSAVREMHRQVGDLQINENGIATRGLLVRHLVMPKDLAGTRQIMRFLAREISPNTYVNIMDQYRPCGEAFKDPDIARSINREEYAHAIEMAKEEGITRLDTRTGFRLRFR
ncbi:MAG: radical SAM protein [Thermodesulfobacteriota bacterium]